MSFYAINKTTQELVNSLSIKNNPKYEFPEKDDWISDGEGIENFNEVTQKHGEIKVIFVNQKHTINYNGTQFATSPHFRIPNATKLGINYEPESIEHKLAKDWIIENYNDLEIYYADMKGKPISPLKLSHLPIKLNEIRFGYSADPIEYVEVGKEIRVKSRSTRIADVLLLFNTPNSILGNGIVFEIQFSKQRDSTREKRTIEWTLKGFSVCWLYWEDFCMANEQNVTLRNQNFKVDTFFETLRKEKKDFGRSVKFLVQEETRKIHLEMDNLKRNTEDCFKELEKTARERIATAPDDFFTQLRDKVWIHNKQLQEIQIKLFGHASEDGIPRCDACGSTMIISNKDGNKFWGCVNYKTCGGKTKRYANKD